MFGVLAQTKIQRMKKKKLIVGALFALSVLFGTNQLRAQVNLPNGLIAHLLLDRNGQDISGNNNHATEVGSDLNGTSNRVGSHYKAMRFNGALGQSMMTFGTSLLNNQASFSMSYWFMLTESVNGLNLVGQDNILETAYYTGANRIGIYHPTSGTININTGTITNTWQHLVITCDNTEMRVYLNGTLVNTQTGNYSLGSNAFNTNIGGQVTSQGSTAWWRGKIDDLRMYNRVINQDEVTALFNASPVAITVDNISGSVFCAGSAVTLDFTAVGDIFTGNEYILEMSNGLGSFANAIELATIQSSALTGTFNAVIPDGTPSGTNYRFRVISTNLAATGSASSAVTINGVLGNIPNPAIFRYIGNVNGKNYYQSINTQSWANAKLNCESNGGHLATISNDAENDLFYANADNGRLYIGLSDAVTENVFLWENNTPYGYSNWHAGNPDNASNEDYVEMRDDNGRWNDINGVTAREYVLELDPSGENFSVCTGATINLNASFITGATYSWSGPNGFNSTAQNPTIPNAAAVNAGVYSLTITASGCSSPLTTTTVTVSGLANNFGQNSNLPASLSTGLLIYYPMNGNAIDASGNGNNGTLNGGVTPAVDRFGNANSALSFNGSNGYISVPAGVYFNGGDFTVSAWVRKSANNNFSRLFDFGNGQSNNNVLLAISSGTSGRPISQMYLGAVPGNQVSSPVTPLTNLEWELLTYTWSGNSGKIYINGELMGQGVQTPPANIVRTINYIGRSNWAADGYAQGRFDDFRLYNRILTENEIQALLLEQNGNLIGYASPTTICSGGTSQIVILNSQIGVTYQMRDASTVTNIGVAQAGNGDTLFFATGVLSTTTNFDFIATIDAYGCSQILSPAITVTVHPITTAPITNGASVCNHGDLTLTASGATGTGFYNWYTVPSGGTPLVGVTANTYSTGFIDETVNYYVSITDDNGCESARTIVTATVINPLNPPVDIVSGLILYYKFDGNLADSSGNNYNGTVTGTNSYVNDRNGNANSAINSISTNIPGGNHISAGNPAKINQLDDEITISMWIWQQQSWFGDGVNTGHTPLVNKWDNDGIYMGLIAHTPGNPNNKVRWRVSSGTFLNSTINVPLGQWVHIVCTYNGATLRIYQNGVAAGAVAYSGGINSTSVNMLIGKQANNPGEITFRGNYDQLRIYNRALNISEVQTLYNNESVAFANTPLCDGEDNLTLSTFNFPGATYSWTGPNGFTSNVQNPPVIMNADSATYSGIYTLQVTAQGCVSLPQTVNAVIHQIPLAPLTVNDTVCGSGNATLTASGAPSGATYSWYTNPSGGTAIAGEDGPTLTLTGVSSTIVRYVSIVRNGCEGPRTAVTAVYYNNSLTNLTVTGSSVCDDGSAATVTVLASESGVNYEAFLGASSVSSVVAGGGTIVIPITTTLLAVGNNTITITATRPGCGAVNLTNTATVTILALPSVSITAGSSLNFCNGDDVQLTATAASSYLWNTAETTQSITVSTAGNFSVTITDANGCSNTSSTVTTTVNALPVPVISAAGSTTICDGDNVTLNASGGTSFLWSTGATGTSILVTQAGTYNFTAFNGTCSALSSDITVTVNAAPTVLANATQTSVCIGNAVTLTGSGAVSYSWNNGVDDGVSFIPAATTTYIVTGTGANGCSANAGITITVNNLPDAGFTPDVLSFCPGVPSITLTADETTYTDYDWYESGTPVQLNGSSSLVIASPGNYELVVTDNNSCTNSFSLVIGTGTSPSVSISSSANSFCSGNTELITASFESGASYEWFIDGISVSGPSLEDNDFNASVAGDYTVEITNASGCTGSSNTINMSIVPGPSAVISSNGTSVCPSDSVFLFATPISGATYQWLLNGNPIIGATNENYYATTNGNYQIEITDVCSAVSNSIIISTGTLPGNAGSISGANSFCAGQSDVYSIAAVSNATSYNWTISPLGAASISSGQGTNTVTVNSTNQNFTLSVIPQNACGNGNSSSLFLSVTTAFPCTGEVMFAANNTAVCQGNQVTYTNYTDGSLFLGLTPTWSFGAGASPATATGNGPHVVTYSTTGFKTVTLDYEDGFGNSFGNETKTNYVNVSGTVNTSSITGNTSVLCNSANETYSVVLTSGSTYNWTVPSGATITSGQGTNNITVNLNGNSGTISVVETNSGGCSGVAVNLTVNISNSVNTSVISGPQIVACASTNENYSVVNTAGSTYTWTVPAGATITSGQGTNAIVVDFNGNFGIVSVVETNSAACNGAAQQITVNCNIAIEESQLTYLNVYPNPTNDLFTIELSQELENAQLYLFDALGKEIKSQAINASTVISIGEFVPGIYFGRIESQNKIYSFRVIKN